MDFNTNKMPENDNCRCLLCNLGSKCGKSSVITFLAVFLFVLSLFFVVKFINEIKVFGTIGRGIPAMNVITVSGKGEFVAIPDVAEINFTVSKDSSTVALAQEQTTKAMNKAISVLKAEGVDEKDIKTTSYNIYPKYEYIKQSSLNSAIYPYGKQTLTGYTVSQSVQVNIKDISKAGDILAKIGNEEVTNLSGLNFTFQDKDKGKTEARNIAIKKAQEEALNLASKLGVKLVRIVGFNEGGNYPLYDKYGLGGDAIYSANSREIPDVPAGENKVISNVSISYEIK